jgi:WD40 repeat protein
VRVVDIDSGDTVESLLGHTSQVSSIAYSGDGSRIVAGSDDASAIIWDAETGDQLGPRLNNQAIAVTGVAFSADGRFVATVGKGLVVWSAETGRELMRVPGFESAVDFSPDAKLIAAVGPGQKTVSLIDCDVCVDNVDSLLSLADERITREPTAAERAEYLNR